MKDVTRAVLKVQLGENGYALTESNLNLMYGEIRKLMGSGMTEDEMEQLAEEDASDFDEPNEFGDATSKAFETLESGGMLEPADDDDAFDKELDDAYRKLDAYKELEMPAADTPLLIWRHKQNA
jgi:hypothetical protein